MARHDCRLTTLRRIPTWLLCTLAAWLLSLTMRAGVRYGGDSLRWGMLRALVKERDGYKCRQCGRKASYGGTWLECDHKRRVADGGSYAPWNLHSLCKECHRGKHE